MHLKPDSRPLESPLAGAPGEISLSELSHLIETGAYDAELRLIAEQAQMLTLASGAAIALRQGELMVCRARAGATAPDLGARLDTQSGLSGECVREARILVCGDTENDPRVNLDVCRYLGIRSIAVLPICLGEDVVGVFEAFSAQPGAFSVNEVAALESMRDLVMSVIRPVPSPAEGPAISALAERAAGEHPALVFDPEDDLLCELEPRAQPPPEGDALNRAFELVKGRGPQPAPFPMPSSPAPPRAAGPGSLASGNQPPSAPAAGADKPGAPAPIPRSAPPPPAASAPIFGEPPLRTSAASASPRVSPPRPVVPFANSDPEDDLICEIQMRSPGSPMLHPRALSTFAPAPYHPPEHAISRKLIVAGVVVALAGLMWLRWCNHSQPAAENSSPSQTVQAASAAARPSAPATAAPIPAVPATAAEKAPAVDAPEAAESLPQSDVSAPEQPRDYTPSHQPRYPAAHPATAGRRTVEPKLPVARERTQRSTLAKAASHFADVPPPASSELAAAPAAAVARPTSGGQQQAKVLPPMPAAPPAQPSPAAFGLRPGPVTATAGASRQLSLSQAVVTTVPQASGTGVLSRDALRLLLDSAAGGDANAQLALAVRYANGEGVRQSYPEALKWFNQARAQGLAPRDGRPQEAWARVQQWAQSHPGKP